MGFMSKMMKGEDVGFKDEDEGDFTEESLENIYMRLYPKMGRDFIHRDDFIRIIGEILETLDGQGNVDIALESNDGALERAYEYKHFLGKGISGNKHYPDLIKFLE